MCIATVYSESSSGDQNVVMEDVVSLDLSNGAVIVTSLLGETRTVPAAIKHIDFVKHTVTLAAA